MGISETLEVNIVLGENSYGKTKIGTSQRSYEPSEL